MLGTTPSLRRLHVIAHSRGSDVLTSALQQLAIEAYAAGTSLSALLRLNNVILFAPDIDIDVAAAGLHLASDPDMLRRGARAPFAILPETTAHLTVYSSPDDKALSLSGFLFGSVARLGQIAPDSADANLRPRDAPDFGGLVDLIEVRGGGDFIGHSYFSVRSARARRFAALLREDARPGSPQRPLVEIKRPFWRLAPPGSGA
jgi:esterase/lipase superfamily enzyme